MYFMNSILRKSIKEKKISNTKKVNKKVKKT